MDSTYLRLDTTNDPLTGPLTIDVTDTEALLIRKTSDGGDIFTVDTTNGKSIFKRSTIGTHIELLSNALNNVRIESEGVASDNHWVWNWVSGSSQKLRFGELFYLSNGGSLFKSSLIGSPTLLIQNTSVVDNAGFVLTLEGTGTEAFLVRKKNDGGDIFVVDTYTPGVFCYSDVHILSDSYKLYLGAGDDMSVYHDGGSGYIDNNTGSLFLMSSGGVNIESPLTLFYSGGGVFTLATSIALDFYIKDETLGGYLIQYDQGGPLRFGVGNIGSIENQAPTIVDITNSEAFLVRENEDGGDIFKIDTSAPDIFCYADTHILSDSFKLYLGVSDDFSLYHDGSNSYITNATGSLIIDNNAVLTSASAGKLQFYGEFVPTSSPSSTKANVFNGLIDLRGCSPASNADFVGNEFNAIYQSNDLTAGFPALSFVGTKFTNLINLNSSGSPRFQVGSFTGVTYDIDFTGSYSTVAGFNAIPMVIDVDFTASVAASHQMIALSLTSDYNVANSVNQHKGFSSGVTQTGGSTLGGMLAAYYGTVGSGTATLNGGATSYHSFTANIGTAMNTSLASGKILASYYAEYSGFTAMANRDAASFYTNLANNARNFSFVSDGADGWMNTDSGGWIFGAGKDAEIYFDGSDLIIKSLDITANDEVMINNFDAVAINNGADLYFTGDGSGLPYGSCYGNEIGWTQASAVQSTWYNISDTDMSDGQLNLITHDGSGKLTVTKAGRYIVSYSVSLFCSANNAHVETGIEVSGSGSADNAGICSWYPQTANSEGVTSSVAILDLAASATIEVAIRTEDAGTPTLGVNHLNIVVTMVGGT